MTKSFYKRDFVESFLPSSESTALAQHLAIFRLKIDIETSFLYLLEKFIHMVYK